MLKTFRWNFAIPVSTRLRGITGKVESKQRYPKQFDRIRSYFYRPTPTKARRNSKYRRG